MSRRWKIGMVFATVFTLVNLGGIPIAAVAGELRHTVLHVVLAVAGAMMLLALAARRARSREHHDAVIDAPVDRIEALQQSVDAIALEVERIGEAQRFSAKLRQEQPERPTTPR